MRQSFFRRLANLVYGIARNRDGDCRGGIVDDSLASEPRSRRQSGRLVEQVLFLLARFAELVEPLLYDHVTGCARTIAAARVLEMDLMTQHHIEDRAGLAVMMKRRLGGIELDHLLGVAIFKSYSQFCHTA